MDRSAREEKAFIISFLDNQSRKRIGGVCPHLSSSSLARFTPGRRPAAPARRSMECYPSDPGRDGVLLLAGKTLVLPVVSHGNVGQLRVGSRDRGAAAPLASRSLTTPRFSRAWARARSPRTPNPRRPTSRSGSSPRVRVARARVRARAAARARAPGAGARRERPRRVRRAVRAARVRPPRVRPVHARERGPGAPGPGRAHRRGRVPKRLRRPGRRGEARARLRADAGVEALLEEDADHHHPRRERERERERNGVGIAVRVARAPWPLLAALAERGVPATCVVAVCSEGDTPRTPSRWRTSRGNCGRRCSAL